MQSVIVVVVVELVPLPSNFTIDALTLAPDDDEDFTVTDVNVSDPLEI